jgi:hypothetical protein
VGEVNMEIEGKHIRKLIEMAFIGYQVISEVYDDDKELDDYNEALQVFYESVVESGVEEFVHFDDELGVYIESKDVEKKVLKEILDEYDENTFNITLPHHLALRDALLEYSQKTNYNLADFYERVKVLEEGYVEEFDENGIDRLGIIEGVDEDEFGIELDHQIYL